MHIPHLIKEAKQGSTAAQKCLFDRYAGSMVLICRRYVKTKEDAEELALDGFYKFFKALQEFQYQSDAALYAWLKKIMINECLMFLRRKTAFHLVPATEAAEVSIAEEALDNLSAAEIFDLVVQLPPGYRTVFNLYAIEGLPHAEIANLLGISEGTSKSQLSKARNLLQKIWLQNNTHHAERKTR